MSLPPVLPGERKVADDLTATSAATDGYQLNHTMLRVADAARSLEFYTGFLGMSLVFRLNAGPFTIYYLGYPSTLDKVPMDMAKSLSSRSGLLELMHFHQPGPNDTRAQATSENPGSDGRDGVVRGGFGHLGLVVPDVEQVLKRARQHGYVVLKEVSSTAGAALELSEVENDALHRNFLTAFTQIGFLRDPDGYIIEVLPEAIKR
ncbi:hypothetical protein NW765_017632 [Fusarium oxysporum]|nr:hypothetical protein NW765_017632 [Fusarium oxysporum]KAJ4264143.1 hypothetical protein NW764_015951 [Fusarium oxysporum]